jgi:hypothetical protein
MAVALLDTLPTPSTDWVDMVYHQLRDILIVATEQQAERLLQWWVEVSFSSPGYFVISRQMTVKERPMAGTASSPARTPSCLWPSYLSGCLEPLAHRQARMGDEGACFQHYARNPRCGRRNDGEWCSLSPEGSEPNNVIKYDGKTNPIIWLEDCHLICRAGGADDDLFIMQFLPIYLADMDRAWLEHLPRKSIDCWEDLKEIFTSNFQGIYVRPGNPWDLKGCRQKQGESLWDYIWRFFLKCHELPKICDADVISAFWSGMNY